MIDLIQLLKSGILQSHFILPQYNLKIANGSVALLLRQSSSPISTSSKLFQKSFDLLLLRRTPNQKDLFSGHLCFPGGGRQKDQQLYDTAVRQTYQQIGVTLHKNQFITTINRIFGAYTPQKRNYVAVFLFQVDKNVKIEINEKQICQYKWIPIQLFLNISQSMKGFQKSSQKIYPMHQYMNFLDISSDKQKQILINYKNMQYPCFDVGMGTVLWGFTLYVMTYISYKIYNYYRQISLQKRIQSIEKMQDKSLDNKNLQKLQQFLDNATRWKVMMKQQYKQKNEWDKTMTNHARQILKGYIQIYPKI